jgi:truncated hemoglobin YjbI
MTDSGAAGTARLDQVTVASSAPSSGPAAQRHRQVPGTAPSPGTRLQLADLHTRDDLERLLRDFYGRVLADPLLRHVFVDVVDMDLAAHLPQITDFWQKVLFGTGAYDGQAMAAHRRVHQLVPLTGVHFARWLDLWRDALAEHYAGPVAERAVAHAERMVAVFLRNLREPRPARSLPILGGAGVKG